MSNTVLRRSRRTLPPVVMALALAPAALVAAALLLSPFFDATSDEPLPTLAQCRTISEAGDRLACYDRLEGKPLPLPAKGEQAAVGWPGQAPP
ncbi:MAG: hypothetical protein AB7F09_13310 [Parvibaculaceae bacterium]